MYKQHVSRVSCHVSRVTCHVSVDRGDGQGLEDVVRAGGGQLSRHDQVHLEAAVVEAGRPQPPVHHVHLKEEI